MEDRPPASPAGPNAPRTVGTSPRDPAGAGPRAVRRARAGVLLAWALACGAVGAAPAPWYQWRSALDGRQACAQTSPGAGWEQAGGPYRDAACRQPLRIIRL